LIYLAVIHDGQLSSDNIAVDLEAAREVSVRVAGLRLCVGVRFSTQR